VAGIKAAAANMDTLYVPRRVKQRSKGVLLAVCGAASLLLVVAVIGSPGSAVAAVSDASVRIRRQPENARSVGFACGRWVSEC